VLLIAEDKILGKFYVKKCKSFENKQTCTFTNQVINRKRTDYFIIK